MTNISIIIVHWNVKDLLRQNLARLFSLPDEVSFEVIVVDNASEDDAARMVREEFPHVRLVQHDWNAGFARAVNRGLHMAKGEVMLLLNPDNIVEPGALQLTYERLKREREIGVLGGQLVGSDGQIVKSVRRDPSFSDQFMIMTKLAKLLPRSLDHYLFSDFDYRSSTVVEQVRGSYFAFRADTMKTVGLFDERYFIWFEEVDYCRRVREAGFTVFYDTQIVCRDLVGQAFKQVPTWTKQRYFATSMVKYFAKWQPWWQTICLAALYPFVLIGGALMELWSEFDL